MNRVIPLPLLFSPPLFRDAIRFRTQLLGSLVGLATAPDIYRQDDATSRQKNVLYTVAMATNVVASNADFRSISSLFARGKHSLRFQL